MPLVLLAFTAATLLHIDRVPVWCAAAALIALAARVAHARGRLALPGSMLRVALALGLTFATIATFRTLSGLAAGSALLLSMGSVKLLETRTRRDAVIVVITAFVLLLAACLDRQQLLRLPLYAITGWLGCAALAGLGSRDGVPVRQALRQSASALLWGLPLALVLFLFVPRLPGSLWSLPGSGAGETGLDDEMSPGGISELAVSEDPAFRVRFRGALPAPELRYWRGPVLHGFDGYSWTRGVRNGVRQTARTAGDPVDYQVIMEPSGRNWWFGLDHVESVSRAGAFLTWDGQLLSPRPVTAPLVYEARSWPNTRTIGPLPLTTRRMDTQLPQGRNPRTLALAAQMRAQAGDERAYVDAVLRHFRDGGFRYTLTPPLLDYNSIDDLLFNTRRGFCGHFASAFATLMRASGIPARVVTGYLGGEWNRVGGYLLVRQSSAHAWTEIWLENEGWVRIDPTAAVAPERLRGSLGELLPDSLSATQRLARDSALLAGLIAGWDAANTWWQERILNFNLAAQRDLLARMGLRNVDYAGLAALLLAGAVAWALVAGLWIARRPVVRADPLGLLWERLRTQARAGGLLIAEHEPPAALAGRIAGGWPELAAPLRGFTRGYLQLRYGAAGGAGTQSLQRLQRQLRTLRRGLARHRAIESHEDLAGHVPLYERVPPELRPRVASLAVQLQRRVHFTGCGGLTLTPFMRRAIAWQACVPVLERGLGLYAGLRSVLVYPDEFVVTQEFEDEAGVITRGTDVLSGQTEERHRVLLSWRDIETGWRSSEPYNVVLHEFAHLLDHSLDGRITRREGDVDADWHEVLEREYQGLCAAVDAGEATLIDPYGAEDPVEFFAVCVEVFFEQPGALRARHAGLYGQLVRLFQLDPARWSD